MPGANSFCLYFLLWVLSGRSQSVPMPMNLPVGTELVGALMCQTPEDSDQEFTKCWFLRPNRHYDMHVGMSSEHSDARADDVATVSNDDDAPAARFNIHLYLDHMWHLNIGFNR